LGIEDLKGVPEILQLLKTLDDARKQNAVRRKG